MSVLAVNAGSSSLKVAWFDEGRRLRSHNFERLGEGGHAAALATVDLEGVTAVGHRFVHGGPRFDRAQRIDGEVLGELRQLQEIDPTHLPAELACVDAIARRSSSLPQVACFDTAFHRTLPRVARLLPIPRHFGLRRYGFHGLSYAYLMMELERLGAASGRIILAHLGSGASLAAVLEGKCLETTMSFTPNSGVVMGTRTGDLDAGLMLHLMRNQSADSLDGMLNRRSGLLGISETSSDMRDLLEREASDERAADAVAAFVWSVKKAVGALAAVLGGVDTLVFSGGIGENAAPIRERIIEGLGHLNFTVRVIPTDEELMIARETVAILEEKS